MRRRALITSFADCDLIEEVTVIDDDLYQSHREDDTCDHPDGHLFKCECLEVVCVYCGKIVGC